ncbi:hypothetical protein PMAYCL1PPCAC_22449 [Pristionchus mayeri]|uniref:Uncharacterized protein n=1 Tax=Pristionchus mayeri TaxID=1317129 RepID=A0AAN5CY66_9BILA|nr:hypothetical protein PMAYCL1PPCAC_22449 [Pristionchus mayeri]
MSDSLFLKSMLDRFGPQLSLETLDPICALALLPAKISLILLENKELRAENAQKEMTLDRMSYTLAADTKKIKDLEDEVKQLREKNEELMKKQQKNGQRKGGGGYDSMERPSASHSGQQHSVAFQGTRPSSIRLVISLVAVSILAFMIGMVLSR